MYREPAEEEEVSIVRVRKPSAENSGGELEGQRGTFRRTLVTDLEDGP